jgi:hypothetical protein
VNAIHRGNQYEKTVAAVAFEAGDHSASLDTKRAPSTLCGKIFLGDDREVLLFEGCSGSTVH